MRIVGSDENRLPLYALQNWAQKHALALSFIAKHLIKNTKSTSWKHQYFCGVRCCGGAA